MSEITKLPAKIIMNVCEAFHVVVKFPFPSRFHTLARDSLYVSFILDFFRSIRHISHPFQILPVPRPVENLFYRYEIYAPVPSYASKYLHITALNERQGATGTNSVTDGEKNAND